MILVVSVALLVAVAAFVALPFFEPPVVAAPAAPDGELPAAEERWQRQKLDAYAAIKEAEFDYRMNKLSDADLALQRDKYTAQALEAIAALEGAHAVASRAPARTLPAKRPVRIAFCPSCGHRVPPRANFCAACGNALAEAVA